MRIDVIPTDTTVKVAHARAILERGVKSGLMHGHASGAHASALTDYARIGQTPLSLMPCRGTDGKERSKSIASVDLGNNAVISGLTTRELGKQTADRAKGYELSKVDTVTLGAKDLVIKGVIGRANVLLSGGTVRSSTDGTETGTVEFQGEPQEFPANGDPLEIPGVAKLEPNIVERQQPRHLRDRAAGDAARRLGPRPRPRRGGAGHQARQGLTRQAHPPTPDAHLASGVGASDGLSHRSRDKKRRRRPAARALTGRHDRDRRDR